MASGLYARLEPVTFLKLHPLVHLSADRRAQHRLGLRENQCWSGFQALASRRAFAITVCDRNGASRVQASPAVG